MSESIISCTFRGHGFKLRNWITNHIIHVTNLTMLLIEGWFAFKGNEGLQIKRKIR